MQFEKPIPVRDIAARYQAKIIGDASLMATGINEIHKVEKGDITFVDVEKYFKRSIYSDASIIILNKETACPPGKALLICPEPFKVYDAIVRAHRPFRPLVHHTDPGARIHPTAVIEPNVVIGHDVEIGAETYIQSGAVIRSNTRIGKRVVIHSGAVIGIDAFYFKKYEDRYQHWRSGGRVIIEDDVLISSGCTISKGVSGDTIIGEGSKLDCMVMIGHGVVIGKHCLLAAQVGIAGKTIVGDRCVFYGQVGIAQSLKIGDDVVLLAQSGVTRDLPSGKTYFGSPAEEARARMRQYAALRKLPDFMRKHS